MKTCLCEGCQTPVWSHKYCRHHQGMRTDDKWLRAVEKSREKKKSKTPIPRRTEKRAAQEAQYSKDRKEFLARPENMQCRVFPWMLATEIHHIRGRNGEMLLDQKWWLPVSEPGHKKIENNPDWARENKFTLSRLSK